MKTTHLQNFSYSNFLKGLFLAALVCVGANSYASGVTLLNSKGGSKMLVSSLSSGYAQQFLDEVKYFTYQENTSYCAVATSVIILNTLGITPPEDKNFGKYKLFTQNNIFTPDVVSKSGISESTIIGHGLSLSQETQLLNSIDGVSATMYSTESLSADKVKKIIVTALKTDNQLVIANILRSNMQESGGGHFSPLVAYDPKSSNVLFMDVASFKQYGPTWVPFNALYEGMHTKDGDSYRGFIIVSKHK